MGTLPSQEMAGLIQTLNVRFRAARSAAPGRTEPPPQSRRIATQPPGEFLRQADGAQKRCCASAHLSDIDGIGQEMMNEFEIALTPMPYVGGAASRMSDLFVRLMDFLTISRVQLNSRIRSKGFMRIGTPCRAATLRV